jgi:hypothetical protein
MMKDDRGEEGRVGGVKINYKIWYVCVREKERERGVFLC